MESHTQICAHCGKETRGESPTGTCLACLLQLGLGGGDPPAPEAPVLSSDRYDSLEPIATGGMGTVYRTRDRHLDRDVALKTIGQARSREEDEVRFIREARITGQLEHPGVAPVHELAEDEQGKVFYTMKYLQGTSLRDILKGIRDAEPPMVERYPLTRLLGLFIKVCDTVAFAHAKGIVHRDLKPANIMVGDYGEAMVLDWGIAKVMRDGGSEGQAPDVRRPASKEDGEGDNPGPSPDTRHLVSEARPSSFPDPSGGPAASRSVDGGAAVPPGERPTPDTSPRLTLHGAVMGTPAFMAPEQAAGKLDEIDARTDVYALGCILYNILTLHPPIEDGDVDEILAKVGRGEITDPETWNRQSMAAAKAAARGAQGHKHVIVLRHMPGFRIPAPLAAIATKAMALAPDDRYASAQELRNDIESYMGQHAVTAMEESLMQALTRLIARYKGIFATAAVAVVVIIAVVAVGYRLNLQARDRAIESEAAVKRVSRQAAPEYVAKAARAFRAQQWEAAAAAATTAVGLDPESGPAWFEKGRCMMQAGDLGAAADCFAKAFVDDRIDGALRERADRLLALARQYAPKDGGELTMPECNALGHELVGAGEAMLASFFFERGGEKLAAVRAQAVAAAERLKEDNPEMSPFRKPAVTQGEVAWDLRDQPELKDLSSLGGLPLTSLNITGSSVSELSVLKGMPLTEINLGRTLVTDLSPLQGMPLRTIWLGYRAPIKSIAPLAGAPIEELVAEGVRVDDLSPLVGMPLRALTMVIDAPDLSALRDMPLKILRIGDAGNIRDFSALATLKRLERLQLVTARISDLSVLEGLPLGGVDLIACHDALDLSPLATLPLTHLDLSQAVERENIDALAGMDLTHLNISRTSIADLSALKGMALQKLSATSWQPIHDYSALEGMPLVDLALGWTPYRYDVSVSLVPDTLGFLKDLKGLKALRFGRSEGDLEAYEQVLTLGAALRAANPDYKAGAFYRLEDGQITEVWINDCAISDLTPLKGLKLTRFIANGSAVSDLTPLAGMPIQRIGLKDTQVTDLAPLKGMPLDVLFISGSPVSDLSPVQAAPIKYLDLVGSKVTDYSQLKGMNLRKVWVDEDVSDAGLKVLREMDALTHINDVEADGFWRGRDTSRHAGAAPARGASPGSSGDPVTEALKARLAVVLEALKKANPDAGPIAKPMPTRAGYSWDLRRARKMVDLSALEGLPLISLYLDGTSVTDLSPLRGMPLATLSIPKTSVTDLSPLNGMPLQDLNIERTQVKSLAPLAGAPLEVLNARSVRIDDLSPLAGMPLRALRLSCSARDISTLRDMPLELLSLGGATEVEDFSPLASLKGLSNLQMFTTRIADLSVLEGLPIERLELIACHNALDISSLATLPLKFLDVSQAVERENIEALAGLDLERLHIDRTSVADLTPLKGMKLKYLLACSYRPIADYSVLEGMPLVELMVGWMPLRWQARVCVVPDTLGFLNDIKTLKKLRFGMGPGDLKAYEQIPALSAALKVANPDYEAGAFYRLEDGRVTEVWLHDCKITDLSPLKGLELTRVGAIDCPVTDLTPLAGMPLQGVHLRNSPVTDLAPLKGMALTVLELTGSSVSDLSPVKGAPITELSLVGSKVTDYGQLKGMPLQRLWIGDDLPDSAVKTLRELDTVTQINDQEVDAFWKSRDEGKDKQ